MGLDRKGNICFTLSDLLYNIGRTKCVNGIFKKNLSSNHTYPYDRENEFSFEFYSYTVISKQSSILLTQTLHNLVESELTRKPKRRVRQGGWCENLRSLQ